MTKRKVKAEVRIVMVKLVYRFVTLVEKEE